MSSRPCRNTSSCAVRTQQGGSWISLASQSHTIWTHTVMLSHTLAAKRDSHAFTHAHRCPMPCVHALRSRDFYHTCYCLSGLSIAQHFGNMDLHDEMILGSEENRLVRLWQGWEGGRDECIHSEIDYLWIGVYIGFGESASLGSGQLICPVQSLLHVWHQEFTAVG